MSNQKIEEINATIKALEDKAEELKKRRDVLEAENKDYKALTKDGKALRDDVTEGQLNYVLGHSRGFIEGLRAASSSMAISLTTIYDEDSKELIMYAFEDLGETIARERMKYEKDAATAEKSGWKLDWGKIEHWIRKEKTESPA